MSFLKDLEALSKPAPAIPDIEDLDHDNDGARGLNTKHTEDYEDVAPMRRRFGGVELDDERYQGEKVSRADLFGDESEPRDFSKNLDSDEEEEEDDDDEEDMEDDDEELSDDDEEEDDNDEDDDDESFTAARKGEFKSTRVKVAEEGDDESDIEEDTAEGSYDTTEETQHLRNLLQPQDPQQHAKGNAVRRQIAIWDQLLFLKIKLHAAMRAYNELPRGQLARQLLKGADEQTKKNYTIAKKNAAQLLSQLIAAETQLLASCPQTKDMVATGGASSKAPVDSDDEEIESSDDEKEEADGKEEAEEGREGDEAMSDDESIPDYNVEGTDGEESEENEDDEDNVKKTPVTPVKKAESVNVMAKKIAALDLRFDKYRKATLQKWDERTRLVGPKRGKEAKKDFSAFDNGVLEQIEQVMKDKYRLMKRTQQKRSDQERIGGDPEANDDVEIFDDDDFYQQMLKDLIEKKNAEVSDPIEMSRQWLELDRLRQKRTKKKKVDTKASKGRKIRYAVIPKLVNYHPAVPEAVKWSHESRNELFKSLFK